MPSIRFMFLRRNSFCVSHLISISIVGHYGEGYWVIVLSTNQDCEEYVDVLFKLFRRRQRAPKKGEAPLEGADASRAKVCVPTMSGETVFRS